MVQTALSLMIPEIAKGKRAPWVAPCVSTEQQVARYAQENPDGPGLKRQLGGLTPVWASQTSTRSPAHAGNAFELHGTNIS